MQTHIYVIHISLPCFSTLVIRRETMTYFGIYLLPACAAAVPVHLTQLQRAVLVVACFMQCL